MGSTWYTFYFQSEENLNIFVREPAKYIPQCGGFCADGIAQRDTWTTSTLGPVVDPDRLAHSGGDAVPYSWAQAPKQNFLNNYPGKPAKNKAKVGKTWFG
eukprot:FR734925.1.p2 GENE.FR734925.1~~FR734925.1.p2  ORF type:complete len:100 (+),score=10.17 FR734925.1:624-923(+)